MTSDELDQIFQTYPESAFRLTLSSGDAVIVDNPRRTLIEQLALFIGVADDPEARVAQRIRVVSIPNIALLERIDRRGLNGRRRRRR